MELSELTKTQFELDATAKRLGYETLRLQNAARNRHLLMAKMAELEKKQEALRSERGVCGNDEEKTSVT